MSSPRLYSDLLVGYAYSCFHSLRNQDLVQGLRHRHKSSLGGEQHKATEQKGKPYAKERMKPREASRHLSRTSTELESCFFCRSSCLKICCLPFEGWILPPAQKAGWYGEGMTFLSPCSTFVQSVTKWGYTPISLWNCHTRKLHKDPERTLLLVKVSPLSICWSAMYKD